jgi:hypothetical protein
MLTVVDLVRARKEHLLLEVDQTTLDSPVIPPGVPSFAVFQDLCRARDQRHINHLSDCCNWYYGKVCLMHERTYTPWSISQPMTVHYWTNVTYGDLAVAEKDAHKFGGVTQRGFYRDCPGEREHWFLIFDDMDKALTHVYHFLFKNPKLAGMLEVPKQKDA